MNKSLLLIFTFLSVISVNTHAGNLENVALGTARELSNNLPQKVNANMTLIKAVAIGKTITLNALLHYDEKQVREIYSNAGLNYEATKDKFKVAQINSVCGSNVRKFIDMGGIVSYHFNFNDGNVYDVITISVCN